MIAVQLWTCTQYRSIKYLSVIKTSWFGPRGIKLIIIQRLFHTRINESPAVVVHPLWRHILKFPVFVAPMSCRRRVVVKKSLKHGWNTPRLRTVPSMDRQLSIAGYTSGNLFVPRVIKCRRGVLPAKKLPVGVQYPRRTVHARFVDRYYYETVWQPWSARSLPPLIFMVMKAHESTSTSWG